MDNSSILDDRDTIECPHCGEEVDLDVCEDFVDDDNRSYGGVKYICPHCGEIIED